MGEGERGGSHGCEPRCVAMTIDEWVNRDGGKGNVRGKPNKCGCTSPGEHYVLGEVGGGAAGAVFLYSEPGDRETPALFRHAGTSLSQRFIASAQIEPTCTRLFALSLSVISANSIFVRPTELGVTSTMSSPSCVASAA